jgi:multidrug efflux pump subunit AcrB
MAVICSVIASMLVSLTVVPFLASVLLKEHDNPEGNIFLRGLKRGIHGTYSVLMAKALKRPVFTLVVALGLFLGSLFIFSIIGFKLFPTSEKPIFLINIKMPLQTSLQESNRITKMVEDSLSHNPHIKYFTSNVGKGNPQVYYNIMQKEEKNDFGQIFVQLDKHAKPLEKKKLIEELRLKFIHFPYAKVEVKDFEQGPPVDAPISIRIFGDNLDTLRRLSFDVERIIQSSPGTIYIDNELNTLKTDIKVNINKEKARTLGVLTADVAKTVRLAIAGFQVGTYSDDESNDYKVVINVPRGKVPTLSVFDNLYINNGVGTPIPLSQIASIAFETSPTSINHFNKNRFARVTAFTKKNVLANNVLKDIVPKLKKLSMPKGYVYKLAGEAESEGDAFGGGFMTVILTTAFLFIAVLILQFKTFKGTLVVLSVIPLGVVGGVSMLFMTGNPM